MKLQKILTQALLPERDKFYTQLHCKLFPQIKIAPSSHSRFWSISLLASSIALVTLIVVINFLPQPKAIALAAAIANTISFTESQKLIQQTVHINKHAGETTNTGDFTIYMDEKGNIILAPENFEETTTAWRYQDNARTDTTIINNSSTVSTSDLVSGIDGVTCRYVNDGVNKKATCDKSNIFEGFEPLLNDGSLVVKNPTAEVSNDPQGDIYLTWETLTPSENPFVRTTTGPSGYYSSEYIAYSWQDNEGKFINRVNLFSQDIKFNAEHGFYPGADSTKLYVQFGDDTGKSNVYLLDINDFSITSASDFELEASRKNFQNLAHGFEVSTNSLDQDTDLIFGSITFLKDHEAELKLLGQNKKNTDLIYTYSVPADLQLYGGTNNALITKASFTIDLQSQLVSEYHFFDNKNTEVENATITRIYPNTDPLTIFTQESWSKEFNSVE